MPGKHETGGCGLASSLRTIALPQRINHWDTNQGDGERETDLREIWKVYSVGLIRLGGQIRRHSKARTTGLLDSCLQ